MYLVALHNLVLLVLFSEEKFVVCLIYPFESCGAGSGNDHNDHNDILGLICTLDRLL